MIRIITLGLFFYTLTACESATHLDVNAEIEAKVQERLDGFHKIVIERCQAKVLEEASKIADSIIIEHSRRMKDTIGRPLKPFRPGQPDHAILEDSLILAPLFDSISFEIDSIQQDTTIR